MRRVHILAFTLIAKDTNTSYTNIIGIYSSAKKARQAYEKAITEEAERLGDKVTRREEYMTGEYVIETDKNRRYYTIHAKELQ